MEPTVLKISRNGLNCNGEDIIKERFPGDGMESVLPKSIPIFSQNEFSATAPNLKKFKALQSCHKPDSCDKPLTNLPNSLINEDLTKMPLQNQNEGLLERLHAKVQFLQEHNEKLIEEKLKISHQLAGQTQVNNELKNLLIASIGDDLEAKHEQMILDRIQRDLELKKLRIVLEENQEEVQQAQIQVDVWRSKFLASRVMNEELVQWKSALYYKYRDSHTALQSLLEEHSKIRALNSATRKGLIKVAELLNSKDASLDSETGLTLVNTAFLNHDLVESLIEILEESSLLEKALLEIKENIPLKCIFKKNLVKEALVKPSELSIAEQLAHEIVMNNGIQTEELVRMRRDYLAHNRISHFLSTNYHVTFNCCNSCRGRLIHLYLDLIGLWDSRATSLAPLSEKQKDSIVELNTYVHRPIPKKFCKEKLDEKSDLQHNDEISEHLASLDLGTRKIENSQQFFSWFSQVQTQMEENKERSYKMYLETLVNYINKCDAILKEVLKVHTHLDVLEKQHKFVSEQTHALHNACEHSLQEQSNLMDQAEDISYHLSFFNSYEVIKNKLTSSTISVTGESFIHLLKKIDEAIEYVETHRDFKESTLYAARFQQCLNQALNLVKQYVTNILRNAANKALAIIHKETDPLMSFSDSSFALLYGKFKSQAMRVKCIMEQIEQRSKRSTEYDSLISDCQQCYLEYRWQLVSPFVTETIRQLEQQHSKNPCTLFRSGCSFMVHVCCDEYQLYHEFFTKGKQNLDTLMENLCGILYETFRPFIIHMTHMETLAELCNILKVEMLEEHVQRKSDQLTSFQVIVSEMLEDVQERLVYRTQTYINKDIAKYAPSAGDLAYPDKLMINLGNSTDCEKDEKFSVYRNENQIAVVDLQAMWYPTVRRTLVCLSKLYNCIGKPTFEGIAQEALSSCIQTLKYASKEISNKKGSLNGHLFLIKHLLIIREQISPFDVDFAIKEVSLDFTKLRTAAYGLLSKGTQLLRISSSNAILEFLLEGVPQLTEYYIDSKKEVDAELKIVCEHFINDVTESYISPLISLLDKIDTVLKMADADGKDSKQLLKQQPFAKADAVRRVVSETYMMLKSKLPTTLQSLTLYLANKDTEYILFKPIKSKVLRAYKQLSSLVHQYYNEEDQQIIGCPTQEQVSLLMSFQ